MEQNQSATKRPLSKVLLCLDAVYISLLQTNLQGVCLYQIFCLFFNGYCRNGFLRIVHILWEGIHEISPKMCPAVASCDIRHFLISCICIGMNISRITPQKLFSKVSASSGTIFEYPHRFLLPFMEAYTHINESVVFFHPGSFIT